MTTREATQDPTATSEQMRRQGAARQAPNWTLMSSHGHVLLHLAVHPDSTLRETSRVVGITERQVVRLVGDLTEAGLIQPRRMGRRNSYSLNLDARLQQPVLEGVPLRNLIDALKGENGDV
jgi:DNA-binding MarR family transcriptional regulator